MWRLLLSLLAMVGLGVGVCGCTFHWEEEPPPDGPMPVDCPVGPGSCKAFEKLCDGEVAIICLADDAGCTRWTQVSDCAAGGGTCAAGKCVFTEPCPANAYEFCRDDALFSCINGVVSAFRPCLAPEACRESAGLNGFTGAFCALDDGRCSNTNPGAGAECRGNDRVTCATGHVVERASCGAAGCSIVFTEDEPSAVCGVGE